MRLRISLWLSVFVWLPSVSLASELIDFEDIEIPADTAFVGPTDNSIEEPDGFGGTVSVGTFDSGTATFLNESNAFGLGWGFAVSNRTDTTTPGFTSGTSAITGTGLGEGADNYATGFGFRDNLDPTDVGQLQSLPWFDVPEGFSATSAWFTNTTYSALSMRQGDSFAKQFGGESGTDPDFFQLNVYGSSDGDALPHRIELLLADFRFEDSGSDYILDEWTQVDLSPLAEADRIYFDLDSSDVGMFGMNTPGYFAIDNIQLVANSFSPDVNGDGEVDVDDLNQLCSLGTGDDSGAVVRWLETTGFVHRRCRPERRSGRTGFSHAFVELRKRYGDVGQR